MKATYWISSLWLLLLMPILGIGQHQSQGKIVFERRVNVFKKYPFATKWMKEKDRIKKTEFFLYFNDSTSIFKPSEFEENTWMTTENTIYRDLNTEKFYGLKDIAGTITHVDDSLHKRDWKITDSKRNIAGYSCRKAYWEVNDSLRIYAWYAEEIIPSIGPETFEGLPGAILGLAQEDGSVIYFAKEVVFEEPELKEFEIKRSKKAKTLSEIYQEVKLRNQNAKWWKIDEDEFRIW